ncbi:MAG: heavy metal translocating P-type ATPase, partial [Candidatus Heimdallarchaeota archaeon]
MRSGEAFQVFKDVSIIAFDKTGTITEGKPKVVTIAPMNGLEDKELLSFAAMLEQYSDHPLARAITEEAQNRDISVHDQKVTNFEETPGLGVKGLVNDFTLNVGSIRYLEQVGVNIQENRETINQLAIEGQTIVGVAKENKIIGFFGIADTIRQGAFEGIQKIKHLGFDVVLITGDNKRTAESIAKKIGIENVIYEVLPSEKAEQIYQLQREGKCVAMVCDGINDAPALMQADIGIAIGAGTDIAIESADIILVNNEISKIVEAYQIGKNSYGKTKQNVILAFLFNGVGIPLAIAGLLHPVFAMIAMATSVTAVLANSFGGNLFSKS